MRDAWFEEASLPPSRSLSLAVTVTVAATVYRCCDRDPQHYRKAALRTDSISLELRQGNKKSDGVSDELGDQIGDTRNPEPEDASQAFYMKGKVTALLATLKEKERQVCYLLQQYLRVFSLLARVCVSFGE